MRSRINLLGVVGLLIAATCGEPARAQSSSRSQDVQVYVGELFGDRLTGQPLSGSHPHLDDNATFGGRYTYHITDGWGLQLSAAYSPSRAGRAPNGASDVALTTVDFDLEWDIVPGFELLSRPLVPYTVVGMGYAWANVDHANYGLTGGRAVMITDGDAFTANVGFGARYYLNHSLFIDFDARYRYLSKLVGDYGQGLNAAETSLSLGYRF